MKSIWGITLSIVILFIWTVRSELKSDKDLVKRIVKALGNSNRSTHEITNPIEEVIKSFDIPRIVITDIWHTLAHYIGRNDLNSFERLEDIGQELLSGFNEREKGTVIFYLYNRQRDGSDIIKYGVLDHLKKSTFQNGKPVKFLIHGFKMNGFSHFNYLLKEAYLKNGPENNIISVDWRRLAGDHIYFNSAYNTRIVGERVGELIVFMKQNGFVSTYDDIHLIGFSLGSHVAGYAGKYVIKTERQQIGRITGLDPAGPTFTLPNPNNRLDSLDAKFVDVIHTSYGKSGIAQSIGHVDFYPNGGIEQPGCEWEKIRDYFLRNCSHERAFYLYLESIKGKRFVGCPCKAWEEFLQGNCNCYEDSPGAEILGEYCNSTARGDLFFETGDAFPSVQSSSPFKFSI